MIDVISDINWVISYEVLHEIGNMSCIHVDMRDLCKYYIIPNIR